MAMTPVWNLHPLAQSSSWGLNPLKAVSCSLARALSSWILRAYQGLCSLSCWIGLQRPGDKVTPWPLWTGAWSHVGVSSVSQMSASIGVQPSWLSPYRFPPLFVFFGWCSYLHLLERALSKLSSTHSPWGKSGRLGWQNLHFSGLGRGCVWAFTTLGVEYSEFKFDSLSM